MPVTNGTTHHPPDKKPKSTSHQLISASLHSALFSSSNTLKIWSVASKSLGSVNPPVLYPEYTGPDGKYIYRHLDFWTSGFFPGCLYLLLERQTLYPRLYAPDEGQIVPHALQLQHLAEWWTTTLHTNARRKDTHDLGFMIAPWAKQAWKLHRDPEAYSSLILAAHSLASRFDERVQSIRSWDEVHTKIYSYTNPEEEFLVIIDNMCNLDLIFWVAHETGDQRLYDMAVAHARTTAKYHVRPDNSTCHVVNYDTQTGQPKAKFTHQGFSHGSCWSRGQAWGVLGFMQTYEWTRDQEFLSTARGLADYFLHRLPEDKVPYWDFDAPVEDGNCPRDTSAGMVAACGLLMLWKALRGVDGVAAQHYLDGALGVLEGTVKGFMTPSSLKFGVDNTGSNLSTFPENEPNKQPGKLVISKQNGDADTSKYPETILDGATVCNYEFAERRWADHGLVYADYYLLLLGNMLLEMGLVDA